MVRKRAMMPVLTFLGGVIWQSGQRASTSGLWVAYRFVQLPQEPAVESGSLGGHGGGELCSSRRTAAVKMRGTCRSGPAVTRHPRRLASIDASFKRCDLHCSLGRPKQFQGVPHSTLPTLGSPLWPNPRLYNTLVARRTSPISPWPIIHFTYAHLWKH